MERRDLEEWDGMNGKAEGDAECCWRARIVYDSFVSFTCTAYITPSLGNLSQ